MIVDTHEIWDDVWKLKDQKKVFETKLNNDIYKVGIYYSPNDLFKNLEAIKFKKVVIIYVIDSSEEKPREVCYHYYPVDVKDEEILKLEYDYIVDFVSKLF